MIQRPTKSQLENIEANLRLYYAKKRRIPRLVKLAGENPDAISAAWKNETLRLWYLCIRHGVDPIEIEGDALGAEAALDNIDWETF